MKQTQRHENHRTPQVAAGHHICQRRKLAQDKMINKTKEQLKSMFAMSPYLKEWPHSSLEKTKLKRQEKQNSGLMTDHQISDQSPRDRSPKMVTNH